MARIASIAFHSAARAKRSLGDLFIEQVLDRGQSRGEALHSCACINIAALTEECDGKHELSTGKLYV